MFLIMQVGWYSSSLRINYDMYTVLNIGIIKIHKSSWWVVNKQRGSWWISIENKLYVSHPNGQLEINEWNVPHGENCRVFSYNPVVRFRRISVVNKINNSVDPGASSNNVDIIAHIFGNKNTWHAAINTAVPRDRQKATLPHTF